MHPSPSITSQASGHPLPQEGPVTLASQDRWRRLLFGGNLLYVASAACILIGIGQIIIPAFRDSTLADASVRGWVTLNFYELALLAATLLVVWRGVLDDAVSLTLLVAIFITGTSITLDTVGPAWPMTAVVLGVVGLLLATAKLAALRKWVVGRTGMWAASGLAGLLLWNFLMPGLLGWFIANHGLDETIRPLFLTGWSFTLLAGLVVFVGACRLPTRELTETDDASAEEAATPFVRSSDMAWVCLLAMLVGTFAHQYALNYVTLTRSLPLGDFLPAMGVVVLVLLEVNRAFRWFEPAGDTWLALMPLAAAAMVVLAGRHDSRWALDLALVNYPPVFMLLMGGGLATLAMLRDRLMFAVVGGGYVLFGTVLIYREIARDHPGSTAWLWIVGAFVLLACGLLASVRKQATLQSTQEAVV